VPVVYFLSGLTCTDENFTTKAGAQRVAAKHGIALVAPDTSPRGCGIEGEDDSWDFGTGAGFYVDSTTPKFKENYNMYSYVTNELPRLIDQEFNVDGTKKSIFGHSMGGHGALICAMKNPGMYKSASAFSPIAHPMACPWGVKAFTGYLGEDQSTWKAYDATELSKTYTGDVLDILCDQGEADDFLKKELLPQDFIEASKSNPKLNVDFRFQPDYDHSYYFIASFVEDHLNFHAKHLS